MPNYLRNYVPGATYFFTQVTARRAPLFNDAAARRLFGRCLRDEQLRRPFAVTAIVLLPDHVHTIWTLPPEDAAFSLRWSAVKGNFTRDWLRHGGLEEHVTNAQRDEGRRGVWQPRFIEHTIRDDDDFIHHLDYIHYNPVNHGYVRCPRDWPWSSFHRYVWERIYPADWGCPDTPRGPKYRDDRMKWLE